MRIFRYVVITGYLLTGIALPLVPLHAAHASAASGFSTTRFSVVEEGTPGKPDVLLIPGLSSPRTVWEAEAKLLAPNYRLHLVQVAGFAGAPAGPNTSGPLLVPVVEELHGYILAKALHPIVIGHSMGGLMALMLTARHPEDVSKLVIVDALPFSAVMMDTEATVESVRPQAEMLRGQLMALPADQYAAMQSMLAAQWVKGADAQKLLAANSIASDRAVTVEALVEDLQTDLRSNVPSIKTPTLVLYASDVTSRQPDPAKSEAAMQAAYKSMPNVTLTRIEDSRHFIMYDQPEKFDAALEVFLK